MIDSWAVDIIWRLPFGASISISLEMRRNLVARCAKINLPDSRRTRLRRGPPKVLERPLRATPGLQGLAGRARPLSAHWRRPLMRARRQARTEVDAPRRPARANRDRLTSV